MKYTQCPNPRSLSTAVIASSFFFLFLWLSAFPAQAQISLSHKGTDGMTPQGLAPGAPAGAFPLSGFESVNPFTGNLSFRLPLLQVGGRGGAASAVVLPIEQKWTVEHNIFDPNTYSPYQFTYDVVHSYLANPNWWSRTLRLDYSPGILTGRSGGNYKHPRGYQCGGQPDDLYSDTLTRLTFTLADGTEFELRDQLLGGQPQRITNPCTTTGASRGTVFVTADGSAATFISDANIYDDIRPFNGGFGAGVFYPSGYLWLRDGTRYQIDGGRVIEIRDRNGNRVTYSYTGGANPGITITDSLNRTVTITFESGSQAYDQITWNGVGGTQRYIRVYYANMSTALRSGFSIQSFNNLFPMLYANNNPSNTFNTRVPVEVKLPNNRSYYFKYNSYGELARVELPTGGAIEYDWDKGLSTADTGGVILSGDYTDFSIYRRVTERRSYVNGTTLENRTTYGLPTFSGSNSTVEVESFNASSQRLQKSKHFFYGHPTGDFAIEPVHYSKWSDGKEYQTESYDLNGTTLIQQGTQSWQQRAAISWWNSSDPLSWGPEPANDPRLIESTRKWVSTNQVSKQTFSYDQYNNQTDVYEHHYGSGSPGSVARRTHTDYLTVNPVNGTNYATDAAVHMRGLPTQQQVFEGATERARTTYEYDNYANDGNRAPLANCPGIAGMDSGYTTSYTKRGNVTRVIRYILANTGLVASDTEFAAYSRYDIAGNVVKTKDSMGKIAEVVYSSAYQYAFPTSQVSPIPDPSGYYASNTALASSTVYDFSTGKVTSSTDANNQTTTAEYNDSLDRLTRIVRPTGGGETTYQYSDTPGSLYLRTQTKQSATTWLDDYTLLDGLGRAWRSAHYEGPSSWSATETAFDALGRAWKTGNPYLVTSYNAATPADVAWTTTGYDALSRVLSVTTPDGSHVDTAYSGNEVTVTDQTLKKRRSYTDALGRLTQVTEDPTGLAYQTYYTYDVLNNLVKVNQGSQNRYFLYDSLSRLVRTRNPEQDVNGGLATSAAGTYSGLGNSQWSIGYSYDANGNQTSKTDARNVTTSYGYDAIDRNIWVSYTGGTPTVERHYDGPIGNGKGRLYYHVSLNLNPTQSPPNNYAYSRLVIGGYDAVGRVTSQTQGFLNNTATTWADYQVSRTYDLAGHTLTQNYPSVRSVTNSYAVSGRLNSFSGNLGDGTSRIYADTFSYHPAGMVTKERFATQTNLYHNSRYNKRLQMVETRLGTSATDPTTWTRGGILFYWSKKARDAYDPYSEQDDNSGNLMRMEHYVPTADLADPSTSYVVSQRDNYEYDVLNRLQSISEDQRQSSGAWNNAVTTQNYSYDRWGNRTAVSGFNPQSYDATEASASNRLKLTSGNQCSGTKQGFCYDSAGNLIFDNQTGSGDRSYDAENRMISAAGGGINYYVYDADGKRVRRFIGAQQFRQVYGIDGELVAEYAWNDGTQTATLQKEYGYRSGEMLIVGESGAVKWLVKDHLGTLRMIADQTGSYGGVKRHDYYPFGEENLTGSGTVRTTGYGFQPADGVRQKHTGYERDGETGLDFAQARYFASAQGRFTSVDPLLASAIAVNPQSWNRYSYTINDPMKYVDPSGLVWGFLQSNAGDRYVWYENDDARNAAGADEVTANAADNAFVYQAAGGAYVRLDLGQNSWRGFETVGEAHLGRTYAEDGSSNLGDLGLTLNTFGAVQGGVGLARLGGTALSRILTGAGSDLTTLGLSSGASAAQTGAGLSIEGMAFELRFLQRHLPGTAQAERLVAKEGAAHVFKDLSTLSRVEADLFAHGVSTGTIRGFARVGLQFEQPIGLRIGQDGTRTALNYAEMKIRANGLYHVIPRTGPSQ